MTHTIKQEEDLWFLAELYYGDAGLWDIIYYANRTTIGDDPENLYPGMKLEIPKLETGDQLLALDVEEEML